MKIKQLKLRLTEIPFVVVFKHTTHSRSEAQGIIVELTTENGHIGYGECLPRPYVTGETVESVTANLTQKVFPGMHAAEFKNKESIVDWSKNFHHQFSDLSHRDLCVKAAIELAILDAAGKEWGQSVVDLLGTPAADSVSYSGIISAEKPQVVRQIVAQYAQFGIDTVKLKVGKDLGQDIENIKTIKDILSSKANIRIDANEAWDLEQAKKSLGEFLKWGITSVEQPLPHLKREDLPALNQFLAGEMDLCLDETVCSVQDAQWVIDNKAASIFNLRVSKCGGLLNCLELHQMAKAAGLKCQLGAQVGETSLLSSAGRALATLTGDLIFHEGSFGTRLLSFDLTSDPVAFGPKGLGTLDLFKRSSGLCVPIEAQNLDKMTTQIL